MVFPANKPELPPRSTRPLRRWRLRSAARWGAVIGLFTGAAEELFALRNGLPSLGGGALGVTAVFALILAVRTAGWAAFFAVVAIIRNAMLPRELKRR